MKRFLSSSLIFAGFLGAAGGAAVHADQDVTTNQKKFDLRETLLRKFLQSRHCPDQEYAELFVAEADAHNLDWRLLPSLALVESGGGRTAKGNNLFGWANGKSRFTSIGDAIHTVASALAHSKAYRDKDTSAKLHTYNHGLNYQAMVLDIMRQISPSREVAAAD